MLAIIPLLTLPFITGAFWALGGGGVKAATDNSRGQAGLNLELPVASFREEGHKDKLSFYNQAQEDSIKRRGLMQHDPYYKMGMDTMSFAAGGKPAVREDARPALTSPYISTNASSSEAKIYERLHQLQTAMEPGAESRRTQESENQRQLAIDPSGDITRLEGMLHSLNEKGESDPELKDLAALLESILDIQHPERVLKKNKKPVSPVQERVALPVEGKGEIVASYVGEGTRAESKAPSTFFGGADDSEKRAAENAIEAVVHGTQTLSSGGTVKLRTTTDMVIGGTRVPRGTFLFGKTRLSEERLLVNITGIRIGPRLLQVDLHLYDLDGLPGIYVPGSGAEDALKSAGDKSLQTLDLTSLDPSLKAQATSAGIQTVKGLLSKRAKVIRVTLKAGYRVLLDDESGPQH